MPELPDLVHVEAGLRAALVGRRIAAARTGDPTVLRIMVPEPFPSALVGRALRLNQLPMYFAMSALLRSSIIRWPLPDMPAFSSSMYSVFTPACVSHLARQWS